MVINYGNYKIDIKAKFNITGKETYTKRETEAVIYELINALRDSAEFNDGNGYHVLANSRRSKANQLYEQIQ